MIEGNVLDCVLCIGFVGYGWYFKGLFILI